MQFIILIISLLAISQLAAQNAPQAELKTEKSNVNTIWIGSKSPYIRFESCATGNDKEECFKQTLTGLIQRELTFSREAQQKMLEGTAEVSFMVNADGSLSDFKFVNPIPKDAGSNDAALRVVETICRRYTWIPARQRGVSIAQTVFFPITFTIVNRN